MLLGRSLERQQIEEVLGRARSGVSATFALVGEAGIGKTVLLDHAAELASGMSILRARGIESEAQIPFASLLELLRPALGVLERIPRPQAIALEAALALRPGMAQERFAVGAATLSLLSAYAEEGPLAVLVDDAHWVDLPSAQALLFAFRRLVADPIAVVIAAREDEPSLLDGADLHTHQIGGLSAEEAAALLPGLSAAAAERLHDNTAGNPLALLELAADADELALAPAGAPVLVSARIARAFLRRVGELGGPVRHALALAATSDSGDLAMLERAATRLGVDLRALAAAETAGLVVLRGGALEFRHPLARSAIYADASAEERRAAHHALAEALPDRDVDRRAWHLASAAMGSDEAASAALEQAGARSRARSAYATAAAAFERAARLTADVRRRARLRLDAADAAWHAGLADRATRLLEEARVDTDDLALTVRIDQLSGQIAASRGPVMAGHDILTAAAERADPERAVELLADAASACFYAGRAGEMLAAAHRAHALLDDRSSSRARFLALTALGMAEILGRDAGAGAEAIHEAVAVVERSPELLEDPGLLPWLATAPMFLRQAGAGRPLLDQTLDVARDRAALGTLPFVLNLLAKDQATTDQWAVAAATYQEAIGLARESDQRTDLGFALAGLAWLEARRGHAAQARALAAEAHELSAVLGSRLYEVWLDAALGELELGMGEAARAAEHFEHQRRLLRELRITDVDVFPAAELVDVYLRLGRENDAELVSAQFMAAAEAKGQPWSIARALRCRGLLAGDGELVALFERALAHHAQTLDAFETARTRLAYGQRLRRARERVLARAQLRAALETFERLDAQPWANEARAELAATGERLRRRDPSTLDELTPQELQIALLLAGGRTTREAAAALFLSPKTIEYHLRHVYLKLGIHSREELARALAGSSTVAEMADVEAGRVV
ncbi:MAG: helix-turn-helix domain-containing protein [Solirubrobacterales bacterium]|nr:helix-turn-helix domain-containing protein [Solirubrobacterales bacterium]